jgi:cell division protein FtsQ
VTEVPTVARPTGTEASNGANHESGPSDQAFSEEAGAKGNAPETNAPETNAPETNAPETSAPETSAPGTAVPEAPRDDAVPGGPGPASPRDEDLEPSQDEPAEVPASGADEPAAADPATVVHPRVWQRRVAVLREQGRRRLRWVVAGVAVLVVLCVVLLVLHTPLLALRNATVHGAQHTGTQAVLAEAGLLDDPPLIDVDPSTVAARVERLPWVAHAVVVRHWPVSVTITVTERVALGSVAAPGGGVAVVDASGRVLAWQSSAPPGPVLVAPVTPGPPGTVLARAARPALEVASALPPSLAGRVRHVTADAQGMVTLDLGGGVRAVLGSVAAVQAKLTALASVLAGAPVSGPAVIDVTVPDEPTVGPPPPGSRP